MKKVRTSTQEDFLKKYPSLSGVTAMNRIDFDPKLLESDEVEALEHYLTDLCTDLTIYMELFNEEDNIEELNKFSGIIFSKIERAYLERICLKFATLMDPPKSCGKGNLSFKRFIQETKSQILQDIYNDIELFYINSGIKNWRNKVLAHADLLTFVNNSIDLNFERHEIDTIVARSQEFVDWICDPTTTTDHRVKLPYGSDVNSFVRGIKKLNNEKS